MNMLKTAAAVALLAGSLAAQAAGGALGTLGNASFASGSLAPSMAFTDVWTFDLAGPSTVAASATNVVITSGPLSFNDIMGFSAMLDSVALTLTPVPIPGGVAQLLATSTTLGPGPHTLTISGVAGSFGATYGGSIVATPVPEPETMAMMLAGLGAVGFIAMRRRRD